MGNNLRDIRRRIGSVETTQKTTRAMKTVSAAKLARAAQAIAAARPYADKLHAVLASVASGADADSHPLLATRTPMRRLEVVVFSSDRGLCGAFNANVIKQAERLITLRRPELDSVTVVPVGRKALDYFRRHSYGEIPRSWTGIRTATPATGGEIAEFLMQRYELEQVDRTILVYSRFLSALTQEPREEVLLPVTPDSEVAPIRYEVEPSAALLLRTLVPRAVEFALFRALLENQAGEHGARMTAMESATRNTEELIQRLTLEYNKARQAAITAELVEVVSAAEAT